MQMIIQRKPRFVHLHVRSDYSMVDGLSKVKALAKKAKSLQMPALALTDFNNLFGLIKFYNYAYEFGIKPIIGSDLLIQDLIHNDINYTELTCLVTNKIGYYNLIQLLSKSYRQYTSNNTFPIIKRHWLIENNEGLILLSGGRNGDIGRFLLKEKKIEIDQSLYFYNKYFFNRFYIELIRTDRINEENYLQLAVELSRIKGLPVVATNDVRFINKQDFLAHEIRVAIHDGVIVNHIRKLNRYTPQQFMKSEKEMCLLFQDIPEALINSVEIALKCNCNIDLHGSFLPQFPTGTMSTEEFLIKHAKKGLEERLTFLFPKIKDRCTHRSAYDIRLQHELQVINQMGFPGYFLIVMEFIQWSKRNNIPVGPGRGSGASSLVAYALKITELDPIKFDLLFERFLNSERISMPDLDIDFCMDQRDLVIKHVIDMYGKEAVSQIITFGTMAAKASIRDVGRALGYPYTFVNRIAKLIPLEPGITLDRALEEVPQLKLIYDTDKEIQTLINLARQVEGIIRNVSKHAGGVVIAPSKITDFSPLYYDNHHSHSMTQFDKDDIESIGLIKFDFLGLRTLTTIDRSLTMINKQRLNDGLPIININLISLRDQKSFYALQTSETTGIFQLESKGIKTLIRRLKPDCFEDLIALIALFRPGPLKSGMVDNFINRKHGLEMISYPDATWEHQSLRPVLESTYGIILYQEQVMQIARILAGYTLGKADLLRRAIGKKKSADMSKQRSIFNAGAIRNGIDKILSEKIFDLMEKFAGYGFNKSHSAAYALISYQTLWLKTYYPAEYLASALSSDMDNVNRIIQLINECRRIRLQIASPNINNSQYYFYVDKNKSIVYGIGAIKGVGKNSIDAIIDSRNKDGDFQGLFDFCLRVDNTKINHSIVEKLIFSGAFDLFGVSRSVLAMSLSSIMKKAIQFFNKKNSKQIDMFEVHDQIHTYDLEYKVFDEKKINLQWNDQILLEKEKEVLGFYLTNHPVDQYVREIKQYIFDIVEIKHTFFNNDKIRKIVCVFGLLISVRIVISQKGNYVLFGVLEDKSGRVDIIVFSDLLKQYQYCLKENNMILIKGFINYDKVRDVYKIIVRELSDINDIRKRYVRNLCIILYDKYINKQLLTNIQSVLKNNQPGLVPVYFSYKTHEIQINMRCHVQWYVNLTDQLLIDLRNIVGHDQIKLQLR